jgi:heme oxygenase
VVTKFALVAICMIAWPLVRLLRNVRERAETVDQLLEPTVEDAEDYVRYLCDLYGFIATIAPPLGASDFASARIHARAAGIVEELLAWGMSDEEVAALARTANGYGPNVVWTEAEALGWLFVVERAILQSARVRCALGQVAGVHVEEPDGERDAWLELGRHMTHVISSPREMQMLETAAHEAFNMFEDWLSASRRWIHAAS